MATALELKQEGWQQYFPERRGEPKTTNLKPEQEEERTATVQRARQAAAVLKEQFGALRVVLVGSLAHRAWFHPGGDVDLAVQGLPPRAYWQALRAAEDIISDRTVDLVEIESVSESLKGAIERYGIEL